MKKAFKFCTAILAVMAITVAPASGQMYKSLSVSPITASAADKTAYDWSGMLKKDDSWFNSSDAISAAEDILKYQNSDGGWKKLWKAMLQATGQNQQLIMKAQLQKSDFLKSLQTNRN